MSLGKNLREFRKLRGFTQKQLAEMIGAKHNSVSNWENDQNHPDPDMIELICGALDISANDLLMKGTKFEGLEMDISHTDCLFEELKFYYRQLNADGKRTLVIIAKGLVSSDVAKNEDIDEAAI